MGISQYSFVEVICLTTVGIQMWFYDTDTSQFNRDPEKKQNFSLAWNQTPFLLRLFLY